MRAVGALGRRAFLRAALAGLAARWLVDARRVAAAEGELRRAAYSARVSMLYGMLSFDLAGTIDETIDRRAGRYEMRLVGQGTGIANRIESSGLLRDGRWAPLGTRSFFLVHGRESRSDVSYDYGRRSIAYQSRSETFFLRRVRAADDRLEMPDGLPIDDVVSATLNHAEGRWPPQPDGTLVTHVVRRRRGAQEGTDDVESSYRAELVPFVLRVAPDPATGKPTALFDLTRFSSWARDSDPARIVFDGDRRPETITAALVLGTTVAIRIVPRAQSEAAGSRIVNVVPAPGSLSTSIVPP